MNEEWLGTFFKLASRIPSEPALRRVLSMLAPLSVKRVSREWITPYVGTCMNKQISIGGKTVRCVGSGSGETALPHIVSTWDRKDGIGFGQLRTHEKSNESTATGYVGCNRIDRYIDAAGYQKAIEEKILCQEGDYLLCVKGNRS